MREQIAELVGQLRSPSSDERSDAPAMMDDILGKEVKDANFPYETLKTYEFACLSAVRDAYKRRGHVMGSRIYEKVADFLDKYMLGNDDGSTLDWPVIWLDDLGQIMGKEIKVRSYYRAGLCVRTLGIIDQKKYDNTQLLEAVFLVANKASNMYVRSGIKVDVSFGDEKDWHGYPEVPNVVDVGGGP